MAGDRKFTHMVSQGLLSLTQLWRLQETDSALDTRRASLDDARARIGPSNEVADAERVLAERDGELRTARGELKDAELAADDLKGKIAPAEEKLYSGSIRNPKELSDLQADIDQLKRQLAAAEDRVLECISSVEAAERAHAEAQSALTALTDSWRAEQAELTERAERLAAEVALYERQRSEQAEGIDTATLKTYDHVRRTHQGRGLAKLDRNLCTGCRISLPTNIVNRTRSGNNLVHCPNCERILIA